MNQVRINFIAGFTKFGCHLVIFNLMGGSFNSYWSQIFSNAEVVTTTSVDISVFLSHAINVH